MQPSNSATTLGDVLRQQGKRPKLIPIFLGLLILVAGAAIWWWTKDLKMVASVFGGGAVGLGVVWRHAKPKLPLLLQHDQRGIIDGLVLSEKTILIDGNNIYHFGLDHKVGHKALKELAFELIADGFRIVCFFDASIYFTLRENGEFKKSREKFSIKIIQRIFGLNPDEIYVVPSGTQADDFIVEAASHMPKSVTISNDKFRDFKSRYPDLFKDRGWRKGVSIVNGELLLHQYKFDCPVLFKYV